MHPFRILLVDDDPFIHSALDAELGEAQLDVTLLHAESGAEALALLQTTKVSLVITDYSMPEMNGLELIAALRQRHPMLPVVMLSSSTDKQADALGAGALKFIQKGQTRQALWPFIARFLEGHSRHV